MFEQYKNFSPFQASLINSQQLAFIGDSVYAVFIRSMLVSKGNQKTNTLHKNANAFVKASGQFEALKKITPMLTQQEQDVVRRAINYKTNNTAKHASLEEYKHATGFEALVGYLYISNQTARLEEILNLTLEND